MAIFILDRIYLTLDLFLGEPFFPHEGLKILEHSIRFENSLRHRPCFIHFLNEFELV